MINDNVHNKHKCIFKSIHAQERQQRTTSNAASLSQGVTCCSAALPIGLLCGRLAGVLAGLLEYQDYYINTQHISKLIHNDTKYVLHVSYA